MGNIDIYRDRLMCSVTLSQNVLLVIILNKSRMEKVKEEALE
jgi:hypothetical protein